MARKPSRKTLTRKLDIAWSLLIRSKGFCERCGRSSGKLDAAHIIGRQNRATRWLPMNGMSLCFQCHRRWHDYPIEAAEWIWSYRAEDVKALTKIKVKASHHSNADLADMLAALEAELELELAA